MTALGKATAVCAALAAALFVALAILSLIALSPQGLDPFDSRLTGYSAEDARLYLAALAEAGSTATYLGPFRQLDTVFPVLLAATFLGAIWANTRRTWMPLRLLMMLFPLLYLWADLLENARVAGMLRVADALEDSRVDEASTLTRIKWFCLGLSVIMVLGTWGYRRLKERSAA